MSFIVAKFALFCTYPNLYSLWINKTCRNKVKLLALTHVTATQMLLLLYTCFILTTFDLQYVPTTENNYFVTDWDFRFRVP